MKTLQAQNRNLRLEIHKVKQHSRGLEVYHKQYELMSRKLHAAEQALAKKEEQVIEKGEACDRITESVRSCPEAVRATPLLQTTRASLSVAVSCLA